MSSEPRDLTAEAERLERHRQELVAERERLGDLQEPEARRVLADRIREYTLRLREYLAAVQRSDD